MKNFSGIIGVMLLNFGSNVPQVRHKMRLTVLFPWQQFCFRSILCFIDVLGFCLNQTSFTLNELVRRRRAIWALRRFQVGLSASPYLVKNEDIWFITERD